MVGGWQLPRVQKMVFESIAISYANGFCKKNICFFFELDVFGSFSFLLFLDLR